MMPITQRTCAKYSRPSTESGSRFLLVHEVALGNCLSTYTHNMKCQGPPTDFHSLHGVRATQGTASDFRDDEYVVYHTAQQQMRYLVEFSCTTDKYVKKQEHLKGTSNTISFGQIGSPFTKNVQQQQAPNSHPRDMLCSDLCYTPVEELKQKIDLSDVKDVKDPLKNIQLGLVAGDQAKIVLKEVHIRAKMVDLVAKVVLLQSYTNAGKHAVEGKYVFAVDDLAVVSGFEAFINGKHVVGKVKEKEEARTEYKQAIKEGHGAYLMEQQGETPEVSTVSVGNLPPGASVLIKITYITELTVDGDNIVFSLPSRLATWKHNEVLNTQTQVGLDMAQVSKSRETSLQVAIEMPFFIESIKSPSHQIKIKKTETKALVALEKNKSLDNQFILQVALASVHSPRMWVERHPESDDSRACMLAFYPEFDTVNQSSSELVLLLDMSNSMSPEDIHAARKVLLLCLIHCPQSWMFNVVIFGTGFVELFPRCRQNTQQNRKLAFNFVQNQHQHYGNTEVYGALKPHFLLPASDGTARNIFLLSDGNIKNEDMVLQAVFENQCHTRIFTMGIGNSCNKHCMRKLAQNGAGAFTHFDPARKSRWVHSIKEQLQQASQPVLTSVDVDWEQFEDERKPLQAPQHISSLFNGSRLVVYGFVPNCTQATLKARIGGKEVSTLVSTSELCITTGKMLHQLTARSIIQDWEDGLLNKDKTLNAVLKRKRKNFIINMSKKFSVVSQFTSFVAVEKRSGDEINDIKPSLEDLVAQEDVDTLMYMGWEDAVSDEQPTAPQRVRFDEAMIQNAREEFDSLVAELDCLSENSYKDTHVVRIMELREIIETATIMQEVNEDEGELCLQEFETPRSQKEVDLIMPLFHDESPESTRTSAPSLKKKESVGPIVHEKVKEDRGNVAQSPDTGQSPIAMFGSSSQHTVSSETALFGGSTHASGSFRRSVFEASNEKSSQSKGSSLAAQNLPSQTTGLSGGGGLFGSPNQTTVSSGGGTFGSSSQSTALSGGGLFGSSNQTAGSSGGPFGSCCQSTASSGGGLFGSPNKTTASSAGGLFGSSNQTTVASGGGVFGSCNQTTASSGGGLFGSPNQTTGSLGGGGLFGSSGQVSASSGERGLFGSPNQTTASSGGGLFGSSNQTTAASGRGVFGSCNQTTGSSGGGGLFGSPNQTTGSSGGGLFGSSSQVSASSGERGLFGSSNKTTASSAGGLFGSSNQTTPSSGVVFGSCNQTTGSSGGGGLFGSPNQTTGLSGGGEMLGSSSQVSASSGEGGLFGSPNKATASSGGGLFGSSNQSTGSPGGVCGLLGQGGLFGSSSKTTSSSGGGTFGSASQVQASSESNQPTTTSGEGALSGSSNQTTALAGAGLSETSSRGGLFGSCNQTTGSSADQSTYPPQLGSSFGSGFSSGSQLTPPGSSLSSQPPQPGLSFDKQPSQTTSGFSFGSQSTHPGSLSREGLFGSPNQVTTSSGGGSLVGSADQTMASSGGGGLFGGSALGLSSQHTFPPSGGIFRSVNQVAGGQQTQSISSQSAFGFGSQPTQPAASSFGTPPSQSAFGYGSQPAQPAASSFGQTAASSFGQTAGSSCGTPPSQSAFRFGSQPTQPVVSSCGTLPSQSDFGFGSQPAQPAASSFGQTAASSFGQTAASSFGQTAASSCGTPPSQSAFGFGSQPIQPVASSFGTLPSRSACGFGSLPTHPTAPSFGTPSSQSAFGFGSQPTQPVASSFGQTEASSFGQTAASSFGTLPSQSTCGFGSQPTHPTAPSFGTHPSQSAFGFGYHPTQQVSSFGRQPAFGFGFQPRQQPPVFGRQPTQTAFGYGSQPAQSGYGFGSQPTQTAIGFGSQPTQTATGFGSQPTQTETGFGSQPAQSGFHLQAANSNLMTQQGSAECDIQNSQAVLTPPVENHAQDFSNLFEKLKICKDTNFSQNVRMMSDDCVWLSFEEQRTLYYYLCLIKKGKVQLLMAPKTDHQSIGVQTLSSGPVDMSGSATVCSSKRKFEDEIPAENKEEDQVRNLQPVRTKSNIAIPLGHQSQSAAQEFADSTRVSYSSFAVTMTSKSEERLYGDDQMTGSFRGGVIGPPNQGIGDETPAQENKEKQALHQIKKPLPVKAKSNHQGDMGTASFAQFGVDLDTLDHLQPGIWWTLGPELTRLLGSVVERCHRELIEAGLNSLGESTAKDLEHLVGSLLVLALLIRHSPVCEVSHDHAQCRPLAEVIHDVFSDVTSSECATKPYWLDWKTEEIRRLFPDTGDGQPWYRLADQMGDMLLGHITSQRFMDVVGDQFTCHEARLARAVGYCRATMNKHKSICSMLELGRNWLDFVLKFI